jgi:surfeit locus 1 family protein
VPLLAAAVLAVLFSSLGLWQLDRAEQKRAVEAAFADTSERLAVTGDARYSLYQPLSASGRYLYERQFLIDNVIKDGRLGYFVVTPLEYASDQPLLLVNRGWAAKTPETEVVLSPEATGGAGESTVTGRVGQLPRVGIRAGDVFTDSGWPRTTNWPTLDDLAAALERDVLPYVLLADPQPQSPFLRRWEPQQAGPMRHIAYAFQWFALAAAVIVTAVVLYRKKRAGR